MSLALDKSKEKAFLLSEKKAKKKIKKGVININKPKKKVRINNYEYRGVVYLSHIPHGFYEDQMKEYFSQFGKVTRLRLARSEKTGRSMGYAFIEFQHAEVAKVVAETMNNYLMCKRLLKARYIPNEENDGKMFRGKNWTTNFYPRLIQRKKTIKQKNKPKTTAAHEAFQRKALNKVRKMNEMLKNLGINYTFWPSDVPSHLNCENLKVKMPKKNKLVEDMPSDQSNKEKSEVKKELEENEFVEDNHIDKNIFKNVKEEMSDDDEDGDDVKTSLNVKKRFKKSQLSATVDGKPEKLVKDLVSVSNKSLKKKKTGGVVKKSKTVLKISKKEEEKVKKLINEILESDNVIVKIANKIAQKSKNKNKKNC